LLPTFIPASLTTSEDRKDSTPQPRQETVRCGISIQLCRLGVRSVELVPRATFPLFPHEPT
jgi:hypothetical protein